MNTTKSTKTIRTKNNNPPLPETLNQVLADSYALLSLTHLAHWNVEGPGFFALHNCSLRSTKSPSASGRWMHTLLAVWRSWRGSRR
jgi:hypothetical protein